MTRQNCVVACESRDDNNALFQFVSQTYDVEEDRVEHEAVRELLNISDKTTRRWLLLVKVVGSNLLAICTDQSKQGSLEKVDTHTHTLSLFDRSQ
jgi:hypothetical protein